MLLWVRVDNGLQMLPVCVSGNGDADVAQFHADTGFAEQERFARFFADTLNVVKLAFPVGKRIPAERNQTARTVRKCSWKPEKHQNQAAIYSPKIRHLRDVR